VYAFCTYFDSNYLARGLALYGSLAACCHEFKLWVLCLDQRCEDSLERLKLPHMELIALADFERGDSALAAAKRNRSLIEYYFTCTPSLPLFLLAGQPALEQVTYIDADLWFFGDPAPLFQELGDGSIGIVPHRFSPHLRDHEVWGRYNVGWLTFRNDAEGIGCLSAWRSACNEWCYDRLEGERFADQKYLDAWPGRFKGVVVLQHKGANVAPWNVARYRITRSPEGSVGVDEQPLLFFHYQGFKQVGRRSFDSGMLAYRSSLSRSLRTLVYLPYARQLLEVQRDLQARGISAPAGSVRDPVDSLMRRACLRLRRPLHRAFHRHVVRDHFSV
jgi:hypothetical protein